MQAVRKLMAIDVTNTVASHILPEYRQTFLTTSDGTVFKGRVHILPKGFTMVDKTPIEIFSELTELFKTILKEEYPEGESLDDYFFGYLFRQKK